MLAPIQFLIFVLSVVLIIRFLATGENRAAAEASVVVKTLALYAIMITGAFWEKAVFGRYLFAPAFFWEDAGSFVVLSLHTLYLLLLFCAPGVGTGVLMGVALCGYAAYLVNAGQFVWKLRAARLQAAVLPALGSPA